MNHQNAKILLDETFDNSYDDGRFSNFIRELFNGFDFSYNTLKNIKKEYRQYIDSYQILGSYTDNNKIIDILVVKLNKGITPYNLRNCAYLEEFEKEKIVYQEMVQESSFIYDKINKYYCLDTGRIITGKNIKYLLTILNSNLFFYAVKYYYGGGGLGSTGIRMKHTFFEKYPAPKMPPEEQKPFVELANIIIAKKERGEDTTIEEKQIDQFVYKLYDLTPEEIEVVEGFNKGK